MATGASIVLYDNFPDRLFPTTGTCGTVASRPGCGRAVKWQTKVMYGFRAWDPIYQYSTCGTVASLPGCPSRWPRCSRAPGVQARCPSLQSRCSTIRSLESRGLKFKLSLVFLSSCFCRSEKTTSAELSRSGRYSIHLVRRGQLFDG